MWVFGSLNLHMVHYFSKQPFSAISINKRDEDGFKLKVITACNLIGKEISLPRNRNRTFSKLLVKRFRDFLVQKSQKMQAGWKFQQKFKAKFYAFCDHLLRYWINTWVEWTIFFKIFYQKFFPGTTSEHFLSLWECAGGMEHAAQKLFSKYKSIEKQLCSTLKLIQ